MVYTIFFCFEVPDIPRNTSKMERFAKILKDTHREKAPSNKTPALTKSRNMGIWVVGTSNQLFIRGP